MIVIDVGCMTRGPEESVHKLAARFRPELLLGFDPDPGLEEGYCYNGPTLVIRRQACGWMAPGQLPVVLDGITTRVDTTLPQGGRVWVDCVDIGGLVMSLPKPIVLKLDCEGSEDQILHSMMRRDADQRLELLLVEWHCRTCGTGGGTHADDCAIADMTTVDGLRCPVEEWK